MQKYGVWDSSCSEWDSGPYETIEEARRHTYVPALAAGVAPAAHRPSKSLVVREWLPRGEP